MTADPMTADPAINLVAAHPVVADAVTADPVAVDLVTDRPRTGAAPRATGRVELALPTGDRPAEPVLLAAFGVLLSRYCGHDAPVIGRGDGVLRVAIEPAASFDDLVRAVAAARPRQGIEASNVRFVDGDGHGGPPPPAELALCRPPVGPPAMLFDERLFERPTVGRMAGHLGRILAQVAARPRLTAGEIDLLTDAERAQLTGAFNATARAYPRDATIHGLFTEQARRAPDRTAVTADGRRLTYRDLERRSDRLAARLRGLGVRVGDPVGLLLPRGPDSVTATLAVLKAGGAYVPIDPDYPEQRAALLLSDSGARVLVTRPRVPAPNGFGGVVCRLDADGDEGPNLDRTAPDLATMTGDDLAYVIYTSGTSGRPKGVSVGHRGVLRLVCGTDYATLTEQTRLLATCSPVFDVATFELWGPLLNGGSVHVVPNDVILDAAALGRIVVEQAITTMWLTSPLFDRLVEQDPTIFRPLRELLVGGDALSPRHVGKALDACPGLTLINGYGPTENTTFSTTHVVTAADLGRIPIGRPIANSTAYVLNRDGQLCPVGVPGELCLGGDGVAGGYLGRPGLTAAAFVPDPFAVGKVMYRSGDVARWRPDGALEFFGRRDHQVKVRGYRIELGEIEHAMLAHAGVRQAVVIARPGPAGGRRLLGYYVADAGVSPAGLRTHLGHGLPEHMVPAHLVRLPALPLNQSGKVDRGALPDPAPAGGRGVARDGIETALLRLVERALGVPGVGISDDLRDLGVDSLVATLVAAGIAAEFGVNVPVGRIVRAGTVERLAASVTERADRTGGAAVPPVPSAPDLPDHPMTPQQERLYVEQCKDETAVHYNVPVTVDLPPGTDVDRLVSALGGLAARHDALRTEFVFVAGRLRQRIRPAVPPPVEVVAAPPDVRRFVRPFELGHAPLWRAAVHQGDDRVRLLVDLHHAITDGVSLAVLFAELDALYHGIPLPPAPRYRDFAHWVADGRQRAVRERHGAYWAQVFRAPPRTADLPLDYPRPAIRALDGGAVEFDLGPRRTVALRGLARRHDVTLFAVLAALYTVLLARLTRRPEVIVGTPVSGRTVPGFERAAGMFVNTVCLRVAADPGSTFGEYLGRVARGVDEAIAHQDYPLQDLVADVAAYRDYARTPLFDSLIALHGPHYLWTGFGGRRLPVRLEWNGRAVFDLNLQVYDTGTTVRASWQYASRLLRPDTVGGWRDQLIDLIDTTLAGPDTRVGELTGTDGAIHAHVPDLEFDL